MSTSFSISPHLSESGREIPAELMAQLVRYEAIFDLIPEAVRVFGRDGAISHANVQARGEHDELRPATAEGLWRQQRPRSLDGGVVSLADYPYTRALAGESVRGAMLLVYQRLQDAHALIEVDAMPLRDENGDVEGAVAVERDVTERNRLVNELEAQAAVGNALYEHVSTESERLERLVRERTQELLQRQEARARERRLAAVGQLAAGVMHDVNNALNPIMAAAHLLQLRADDPAAVREYATRVARAAETGAATAARVMRFIHQEPVGGAQEELVDLAMMADEVLAMMRPFWAERAHGGHVDVDRRMVAGGLICGVAGEVREALLNLVQNALDAMPNGGTLTVTTDVTGAEATIEVRDTGTGMTEEVRERAFDPFFTTKAAGTGLGLSEVYSVMKRHRGRAEIDSLPDEGTAVRLVFPAATSSRTGLTPQGCTRPSRRVLLVEDDVDGREFMQALLAWDGHTVDAVGTHAEALVRLGESDEGEPRYDVLLTDIGLPDGSGWEVAAAARVQWPSMRIGAITGWEPRFMLNRAVDFTLRKPVRAHILLSHVAGDMQSSAPGGAAHGSASANGAASGAGSVAGTTAA